MDTLKNQWGSVKPYTRHTEKCKTPDVDTCNCPKWLYVNPRDGQRVRYSLNTPSWTEALERATDKLNSLNPEIAELRETKQKKTRNRKTVYQAINLWLDRTRNMWGADSQIVKQYRSTFGWVDSDGVKHGGLLRYAAERELGYIDEFSTVVCQEWLTSDSFPARKASSRKQCWGTVRSFFNYLTEMNVISANPVAAIKAPAEDGLFAHNPYTDQQYAAILKTLKAHKPDHRVRLAERKLYIDRMWSMVEILRWTGMDVIDAVQFRTEQIEDVTINGATVSVLRYRRTKTIRKGSIEAAIPLADDLAKRLRSVPISSRSVQGMPFRYVGTDVKTDVHTWARRIKHILTEASVGAIALTCRDGRPALNKFGGPVTKTPDLKMFRHTFAVGELVRGVPEEVVARMMGHVSTDMIRKHYAPWCKRRDEAHILAVLAGRDTEKAKKGR